MALVRVQVADLQVVVMVCGPDGVGRRGSSWEQERRGSEDIYMGRSGGSERAVNGGRRRAVGNAWGGVDGDGEACEGLHLPVDAPDGWGLPFEKYWGI